MNLKKSIKLILKNYYGEVDDHGVIETMLANEFKTWALEMVGDAEEYDEGEGQIEHEVINRIQARIERATR